MDQPLQDGEVKEKTPLLPTPSKKKLPLSKILRGLGTGVCIALIVGTWVTTARSLQGADKTYRKPFFQTYLIRSFYSVLYIGWKVWLVFPGNFACNRVGEGTLTNFRYLAVSSGVLALILFISEALWYLSLTRTSLSANTAVFQSASAVVFVLSIPVLRERVSLLKIISVCLSVTGVTLVSVYGHTSSSDSSERSTPLGYVYLTGSTILYAISEVGFKKFLSREDDPAPVQNGIRCVGYLGVHTLLWMWPILFILHFTGGEPFELPDLHTFELLVANASLAILFNASLFVCIALSSPLIATVGSVLVIPASVLVDKFFDHYLLPWRAILGVVIIVLGFFALVFSEGFEVFHSHRSPTHPPTLSRDNAINIPPPDDKWTRHFTKRKLLRYII